jgi:hypothetical protein
MENINDEFRIPFSKVLRLVQSKRYVTSNTKYIFREACLFNVDLEAEHVQGFVNDDDDGDVFSGCCRPRKTL